MTTSVSVYPDWRESEYELTFRVLGKLATSKFFSNFPSRYVRVKTRQSDERDRPDAFIRFSAGTIHDEPICVVEKVIQQLPDCVMIIHRNNHPSRCGKMQETHTTKHTGNVHDIVNALSESTIATMSSLCRLHDSRYN